LNLYSSVYRHYLSVTHIEPVLQCVQTYLSVIHIEPVLQCVQTLLVSHSH